MVFGLPLVPWHLSFSPQKHWACHGVCGPLPHQKQPSGEGEEERLVEELVRREFWKSRAWTLSLELAELGLKEFLIGQKFGGMRWPT